MKPLHEARERVAQRVAAVCADGRAKGAVLLATCNRFEVFFELGSASGDALRAFVFDGLEVPLLELHDEQAIDHLLRVASGLESLVLGEDQIIGQVGQAFRSAKDDGHLGKRLHMLWSRAMHVARRLRGSRPIVSAPRSVAELGARIAREAGPRVVIVGAGVTAHTAAEALQLLGARELHFVNRTLANARRLAEHFGGTAGTLDDLLCAPPDADAVLVAISGCTLHLPVAGMPSLHTVVDVSQPAVAVGLEQYPWLRHVDLDGLAAHQHEREDRLEQWAEQAGIAAVAESRRIWGELHEGRADLGKLLDLHVESAVAEVERALRGRLSTLDPQQAEEVRRLVERVARRNAHMHLSDVKHFGDARSCGAVAQQAATRDCVTS